MERRPTPKERWDKQRQRQLGARSIWDDVREHQVRTYREMSPDELARQSGQYEILSAQQVCAEKLAAARESGDTDAIEAWGAAAARLAEWREEYYRRSQQPSRFSSWAAQSYANRPRYNPRAPW